MKRLIDANALMKAIKSFRWIGVPNTLKLMFDYLRIIINEQPTVDAVEVVHGEWVVCGDGEYVPFICSACGKTTSWYHKQTANYCPNCGAKMDGERKNNESIQS